MERWTSEAGNPRLRSRHDGTGKPELRAARGSRIATFDQDGTLWVEHPMYTQVVYCLTACRRRLHDDAAREYAYGPAHGLPDTRVGTFTQGLFDEAKTKGWAVISMKSDWKRIFAFE
jgi:hypothetical protein